MSDALSHGRLGVPRRLREDERGVIADMVKGAPLEQAVLRGLGDALVRDMPDGGMGSIEFVKQPGGAATLGKQVAEGAFRDADGVAVSVTLNLDSSGELFELDVFKADGSPLVRYPEPGKLSVVRRRGKWGLAPPQ